MCGHFQCGRWPEERRYAVLSERRLLRGGRKSTRRISFEGELVDVTIVRAFASLVIHNGALEELACDVGEEIIHSVSPLRTAACLDL
jgi:hypothetical protein